MAAASHRPTPEPRTGDSRVRDIRRLELEIYRQSLFLPTTSRMQHEHQLDAGKAYTELGGNGPGHVRCQQLEDDYRHRLDTDDWNYRPHHP